MTALRDADSALHVWAWTPVEWLSAVCRLEREGKVEAGDVREVRRKLDAMRRVWSEVTDLAAVSARAERCLKDHALRAADAGQLAAALLLSERLGSAIPFVTLDRRVAEAARRERLEVVGGESVPAAHEPAGRTRRAVRGAKR